MVARSSGGSRYLKEPFDCSHAQRFDATERIVELKFDTMEKRLERIEATMALIERRVWMTIYGVLAVILAEATQSIVHFAPN